MLTWTPRYAHYILVGLSCLTLALAESALAASQVAIFTGAGSSPAWSDPANWSSNPLFPANNPPTTFSVALSGANVTLDGSYGIDTLVLQGSTIGGAGNLNVLGPVFWGTDSTLAFQGTFAAAEIQFAPAATRRLDGTDLEINGNATLLPGGTHGILVTGGASILQHAGGVFDLQTDGSIGIVSGSESSVFTNEGTLRKSGTAVGTPGGGSSIGTGFVNSGDIDVQRGGLGFIGPSFLSTGSIRVAAGAGFSAIGDFSAGSSVTGAGAVEVGGEIAGIFDVTGPTTTSGVAHFTGPIAHFDGGLTVTGQAILDSPDLRIASLLMRPFSRLDLPSELTLGGLFQFGGTLAGDGILHARGGVVLESGGGNLLLDGTTLSIEAPSTLANASLGLTNDARLVNVAGNELNWNGPSSFVGSTGRVVNAGTLRISRPAGTALDGGLAVPFENSGLVDLIAGRLNVSKSMTSTGNVHVASGATFSMGGDTSDPLRTNRYRSEAGSSIEGDGDVALEGGVHEILGRYDIRGRSIFAPSFSAGPADATFSGEVLSVGALRIGDAHVNFATGVGSIDSLDQAAGALRVAGDLSLQGPVSWCGGTWSGADRTSLRGTSQFGAALADPRVLDGREVVNHGSLLWDAFELRLANGARLENHAGASFEIISPFSTDNLVLKGSSGTAFESDGLLRKTGAGDAEIQVDSDIAGTLAVDQGSLYLGGPTQLRGNVQVAAGSQLVMGPRGPANSTAHHLAAGSIVSGAGGVTFGSPTIVEGAYTVSGSTVVTAQATTFVGSGFELGAVQVQDGSLALQGNAGASSVSLTGGTLRVDGGSFDVSGGVTVGNFFSFPGNPPAALVLEGADVTVGGSFDVKAGDLTGTGRIGAPLVNVVGAPGIFNFPATPGRLLPGGQGTLGVLSLTGDLALSPNALLSFEIADLGTGSEADRIEVSGDTLLGGVLAVSFLPAVPFVPSAGETFSLLEAGAPLAGTFSNVDNGDRLLVTDGSCSFIVNFGAGSIFGTDRLVLSDFRAVPEPSAGLLLTTGLVGLGLWKRPLRRSLGASAEQWARRGS